MLVILVEWNDPSSCDKDTGEEDEVDWFIG